MEIKESGFPAPCFPVYLTGAQVRNHIFPVFIPRIVFARKKSRK
jgi:hypothetical protein